MLNLTSLKSIFTFSLKALLLLENIKEFQGCACHHLYNYSQPQLCYHIFFPRKAFAISLVKIFFFSACFCILYFLLKFCFKKI